MHEAKSRRSELAERVWRGERVIIAKAGNRLSEDFDETSDDVIAGFEGEG